MALCPDDMPIVELFVLFGNLLVLLYGKRPLPAG